jgi:cytochrome P450
MLRWSRDYGEIVPLRFGGLRGWLVTTPALAEEVLVGKQRSFRKPPAVRRLAPVVGRGIFSSDGELWRRQRRLVQPAFQRERVDSYTPVVTGAADEALARWTPGEVIDARAEMMAIALRIVARALFGAEIGADVNRIGTALAFTSEHLQTRLDSLLFYLPDRVPTPGNRRMWREIAEIESVVNRIVRQRRVSGEDRGDLLSMLLAARDEDGQAMSARQLRDEAVTLLVAGHETTAVTLTWAWFLLAQNPPAAERLHAEIDSVLGTRPPDQDDFARLSATQATIYEVLRLFPPAYVVGREPVEDVEIGGERVRQGSTVLVSPWALHRDPRWFEEAEAFRPERWSGGLARRLPRGAYIPFGEGPRKCIGASFAMREAVLVLARIAQCLRLQLEPGQKIRPIAAVSLRPNGELRMRVSARA